MTKLDVSPDLQLPDDAVTRAFALLAMKGAGKSNVAVVMAEEMFDNGIPWVAIDPKGDWWGIRSSANGKGNGLPVPIFGGLHADVPIEAAHGARMADLIVDNHLTCLIDVSEMSKGDSIRFLTAFFERLYRRKSKATYPMHLFLEECDDYVPQRVYKEISNLVRQVELVVKRGRQRGLGITLATQRSASVNKDVLTQTDTLIALRSTAKLDRNAIEGWMDFHAGSKEIVGELPMLENGEAWVSSPEHLRILAKVKFRRRRTFDSGATPELGETVKAATLADIDVDAISSAFAETIEKAKADDPVALRGRIAELQKAASPGGRYDPDHTWEDVAGEYLEQALRLEQELAAVEAVPVEVPVLTDDQVAELGKAVDNYVGVFEDLQAVADGLLDLVDKAEVLSGDRGQDVPRAGAAGGGPRAVADGQPGRGGRVPTRRAPAGATVAPVPDRAAQRPDPPRRRRPGGAPVPGAAATAGDLPAGEAKVLTAIAQQPHDMGVTREQLTVLTGYKRSSRDTYIQRLRTKGYVSVVGSQIVATFEGLDALGPDFEPLPTGRALREHWLETLPEGERRILAELITAWPRAVPRDELSEVTGYKRSSRDTYLQRLRARQLVVTTGGAASAAGLLFDEGER